MLKKGIYMYEWDETKNQINIDKHGIAFEIAQEILNDPHGYEVSRVVGDEVRIKYVGKIDNVVLSVVYTIRGAKYRVISVRCASKTERRIYNEYKN
jgi:uncharacterized DUF497 family protein